MYVRRIAALVLLAGVVLPASAQAKADPAKAAHARVELAKIARANPTVWPQIKRDLTSGHIPSRAKILAMGESHKAHAADNVCSPQCQAFVNAVYWDMVVDWNTGVTYWMWQSIHYAQVLQNGGWVLPFDVDDGGVGLAQTAQVHTKAHSASCFKTVKRDHWWGLWSPGSGPHVGRLTTTITYWCGSGGVISGYQTTSSDWAQEPFCMDNQEGTSSGNPLVSWFGTETGHPPHYVLGVGMFGNLGVGIGSVCVDEEGGHAIIDVNPYGAVWHSDYWGY